MAEARRTLVFAAGGTGGHVYPAIAVARAWLRRRGGDRIVFAGTERGVESRVVPKEGFELRFVRSRGVVGRGIWKSFGALWETARGVLEARQMLNALRPDVVMGTGGYASVPVALAARWRGAPTLVFEPNRSMGLANRLLLRVASRAAVAFHETLHEAGGKAVWTGTPVRALEGKPREHKRFGVLVMGGSQGAQTLNAVVRESLPLLAPHAARLFFIHLRGEGKGDDLEETYRMHGVEARVFDYLDDMAWAYAQADVVAARAGAVTLAETAALGKAAIFIPLPRSAGGHQRENALAFERAGAALCLDSDAPKSENERLGQNGADFAKALLSLLQSPERLRSMGERSRSLGRPDAAERVADVLEEMLL